MTVSASFQPSSVASTPGTAAALTLRLHNDADAEEVVKLKALGDLAGHTVLQSETIYLEPGETFDVPVIVDVSTTLTSGAHSSGIEVSSGNGSRITAEAILSVEATVAYTVSLLPPRSSSGSSGKHQVIVDNTGNTAMMIEVAAEAGDDLVDIELAAPLINVDPGKTAKIEMKLHPRSRFWSGPPQEHPFTVRVAGSDHQIHELEGVYEQGPRVRPWFVPALAGMLGAILIGTIAWFALLRPAVESIADDRAAVALEEQQAVFDDKVAELEDAAERARQLPFGTPADLRLNAEAAPGGSANESFTVASDRVLSVTDVVFQNPDGAVGRVALLRSSEVLLESELANFRDLDLHFVAPFRFDGSDTVEIRLDCETPGPSATSCTVGASIIGFVDQAD
jgi:hypothetical protein